MIIKCLKIALLATERARLAAAATTGGGVLPAAPDPDSAADRNPRPTVDLAGELARLTRRFKAEFINPDGTCTVNEQTAIAMLIVHDVHDGLEPLAAQLRQAVEAHGFHHHCGMVGLRHLYEALNQIGAPDYAYRVITAQGYPSYADWVAGDATTLWETWQPGNSKNHHMYSHFMAWLMKTLVGINPDPAMPGYARVILNPAFLPGLAWCRGWQDTAHGRIAVDWQREESAAAGGRIILRISLPAGVEGVFGDRLLPAGEHDLIV